MLSIQGVCYIICVVRGREGRGEKKKGVGERERGGEGEEGAGEGACLLNSITYHRVNINTSPWHVCAQCCNIAIFIYNALFTHKITHTHTPISVLYICSQYITNIAYFAPAYRTDAMLFLARDWILTTGY